MTDDPTVVNPDIALHLVKIIDLASASAKRAEKRAAKIAAEGEPPKKIQAGEIYETLYNTLAKTGGSILPVPDFTILGYELDPGVHQAIIETKGGECTKVGLTKIRNLILSYCKNKLGDKSDYRFTAAQAQAAADYWDARLEPIPKPPAILQASEPGRCLRRLPVDPLPNPDGKLTPLFNELLERVLTNREQMKAYLWSMFVSNSYSQQYLYLLGEGNDGKGALTRVFLKLLGPIASVQNTAPWKGNKHWAIPFVDKRLVLFPDFQDYSSLDNGILKSLSGGDSVYVDPKGAPGYTTTLCCKLIFSSNHMPNLGSSKKSDTRRIILVKFETTEKFDADYEGNLWDEVPYFLSDCRDSYNKLCPTHGPILADDDSVTTIADAQADRDGDLIGFFDFHFEENPKKSITPMDITKRLFEIGNKDGQFNGRLMRWLKSKGYEAKRPRVDGVLGERRIKGLALRAFPQIAATRR